MGLPLDPECPSSEFKKTYMTIFLEIFFLFVIKNLGLDPDSATTCKVPYIRIRIQKNTWIKI